jgi:hypothetical protein
MPYIQKLTTPFLTPLGLLFLLWISYRTTNHIFSRRQRNENSSQFWVLLHISTMYLDMLITATYIYNVFRYAITATYSCICLPLIPSLHH